MRGEENCSGGAGVIIICSVTKALKIRICFSIFNLLQPEEFAQQLENFDMEILPSSSKVVKIDTESLEN